MKHHWPHLVPFAAALTALWAIWAPLSWVGLVASALALTAAVLASVHHAEVIAHRVGEPYGTLVLALAVTIIEVALIVSIMWADGADGADSAALNPTATLPRDTIYAAIMIICNGVVGLCILLGGMRHREQTFRIEGAHSGLAALATLAGLVLVLPNYTTSSPEGTYTHAQLIFAALSSLTLWSVYVFIQTVRHRDYFLPTQAPHDETVHAAPPTLGRTVWSFVWLLISLVTVVALAKRLSPSLEAGLRAVDAPVQMVGILIALLVLLPETLAALRAAHADRLQTSMNLALGSALASIGLTIPSVVALSVWLGFPLTLGLEAKDIAMLALTFGASTITLASGRTHVMHGAIHLCLFAAFLFLTLVP
ncbi:MAG: hypothetical protein RLZZ123_1841 [Pseudomonadota bacterium]|jgi:Ca2+:H+ antiporter